MVERRELGDRERDVRAHADLIASGAEPLRLHIGGKTPMKGWRILNIQPGPGVDYVGSAHDLSQFADASAHEIYASHVYEHLTYSKEFEAAIREAARVLRTGGRLRVAVPDLETLCRLYTKPGQPPERQFALMRMMFGGQLDEHDRHRSGLNYRLLRDVLAHNGFEEIRRVRSFGLLNDTSEARFGDTPISLNVEARRSSAAIPGVCLIRAAAG